MSHPKATLGRVVIYRSRTGRYDVPAIVTATVESLDPQGVALYESTAGVRGVPPLTADDHVHLTVLTPGLPGFRAEGLAGEGDTPLAERDKSGREPPAGVGFGENMGGTYQEWDVPYDVYEGNDPREAAPGPAAGTWRWPERQPETIGEALR